MSESRPTPSPDEEGLSRGVHGLILGTLLGLFGMAISFLSGWPLGACIAVGAVAGFVLGYTTRGAVYHAFDWVPDLF